MKIGDYVRTINGKIYRILDNDLGDYIRVENEYNGTYKIDISNIIKSSPNIIDLIEVGDFIGKILVEEIRELNDGTRVIVMADGFDEYDENEDFLRAGIVTKEQFESMEYRIGE